MVGLCALLVLTRVCVVVVWLCPYIGQGQVEAGQGQGGQDVQTLVCLPAPGGAGYQILAPAYYDQNGQLVMGNGRGIGTPVRLVPPTPILVNATAQQGRSKETLLLKILNLLSHNCQYINF